ncbi:MAG TPA: choice-of-anchor V domain-containing protein [Blastocatellia bacterium]|nr:choice-of-anchor V domain-containing protein [Blastocatellia bacterium]
MGKLGQKQKALVLYLVLGLAVAVSASVFGPEASHTGAPGETSCVICHDTYEQPNVGPGSVTIEGNPAVYNASQQYTLNITVQQGSRPRFGFQLTAIDLNGNRAGSFTALSGDSQVNVVTGPGGRQYIQHTQGGTTPNGSGRRTWQVRWTAPDTDVGTVRFFVAGNAANGDGTNQNDYIYTNSATSESGTSQVTIAFASLPDGMTLAPGSHYIINWTATGVVNIDSYEARYSTDDGMTFPIGNLMFSSSNASMTSYDWTVPNKPSTTARIRLQAATKAGNAVEIRSGRFTISDGVGTPSGPTISSASIDGKALFVNGDGFQMEAKVFVDGEKQKTANLDDFSHQLKCKKAGKFIAAGATVMLVVKNPDGTESPPFSYTRPVE